VDEWTRPEVDKPPLRASVYVNLGVALEAHSLFHEAAECYAQARKAHPAYAKVGRQGERGREGL
jgi:hypothetical protein